MLPRLLTNVCDVGLVILSCVLALALRENFEPNPEALSALVPYIFASAGIASLLFPMFGTDRTIWRLTTFPDYTQLILVSIAIVMCACASVFAYNRLDRVARSIPVLHLICQVGLLVGVRVMMRARHQLRSRPVQLAAHRPDEAVSNILIIGYGRMTEAYIRAINEFMPSGVRLVGLLAPSQRQSGRTLLNHPVLGAPEDLVDVLRDLETHGAGVHRVVVTVPLARLSDRAKQALSAVEDASMARIQFLDDLFGWTSAAQGSGNAPDQAPDPASNQGNPSTARSLTFALEPVSEAARARPAYWALKRTLDVVGACCLIICLSPLIALSYVITVIDVGVPAIFWQFRPGLGGRPLRVCKFRTMRQRYAPDGRRLADDERVSAVGRFMRATRLDELPQLFSILSGGMSFIGPRPLLPVDQDLSYAARLMVRPGLTGWAQVQGGRDVSAVDKAALDVWYVMNASFVLDVKILFHTLRMVAFGERVNIDAVKVAWRELAAAGVCENPYVSSGGENIQTSPNSTGISDENVPRLA